MTQLLTFDGHPLHIEDVTALSRREKNARLSGDSTFLVRIEAGAAHVARTLAERGIIYGVTTSYQPAARFSSASASGSQVTFIGDASATAPEHHA